MRARLQQEAAALLGVSEDALEEDFKKVLQEVEARRPQRLQESTAEDLEFLGEPDIVDFDDVEPVEEPLEASPAASTASSLADALAELVLHHYDNQPLLEEYPDFEEKGYETHICAGISSFSAAAAKAKISLCENRESFSVVPAVSDKEELMKKLSDFDICDCHGFTSFQLT